MSFISLDIGGTKIAGALFLNEGKLVHRVNETISGKKGDEVAEVISKQIESLINLAESRSKTIEGIGACVPGIYNAADGIVWAPNIAGWDSYPLLEKIGAAANHQIPIQIESDRSCYILGEVWKGNAQGCKNALFIAVGTGIGSGILVDGKVLHGAGGIAGAVGWMGLDRPFQIEYQKYGCFEYHASGDGIARMARKYVSDERKYQGLLKTQKEIAGKDVFTAYEQADPIATLVIQEAVQFWGMAAANLISTFNPEKVLFGGGIFDAAAPLLDKIKMEAQKWAQPLAFKEASVELAGLGSDAGLFGAAYLTMLNEGYA
jgi:glucokinase